MNLTQIIFYPIDFNQGIDIDKVVKLWIIVNIILIIGMVISLIVNKVSTNYWLYELWQENALSFFITIFIMINSGALIGYCIAKFL